MAQLAALKAYEVGSGSLVVRRNHRRRVRVRRAHYMQQLFYKVLV
jgi:hypothetical protein